MLISNEEHVDQEEAGIEWKRGSCLKKWKSRHQGLVHPKMKILSLITRLHVVPNPVRPSFIFGTQIQSF